jgi:hypothetical protein
VIAALHIGATVPELPAKTGLTTEDVISTLGWLSKTGLVELDDQGGGQLEARLTEPAKAALSTA